MTSARAIRFCIYNVGYCNNRSAASRFQAANGAPNYALGAFLWSAFATTARALRETRTRGTRALLCCAPACLHPDLIEAMLRLLNLRDGTLAKPDQPCP